MKRYCQVIITVQYSAFPIFRYYRVSGWLLAAVTCTALLWGANAACAAIWTDPTKNNRPTIDGIHQAALIVNKEVGFTGATTDRPNFNNGALTGTGQNAFLTVTDVTILQDPSQTGLNPWLTSRPQPPIDGIGVSLGSGQTAQNGNADILVNNTNITNLVTAGTGSSLGINISVGGSRYNASSTGNGILTMTGTNNITIGRFDVSGQPIAGAVGNGGGILMNVHGTGYGSATISGQIDVLVNSIGNAKSTGNSPARDDGIEITTRAGNAILDMSGLTGASNVYVNGGNGVFVNSYWQTTTPTSSIANAPGDVIIRGISNLLTITVDNTYYGSQARSSETGYNYALANAGILASSFGTGNVTVEITSATINTSGPLASGVHAMTQQGTVSVNNAGVINTSGTAGNGIEAATTNTSYESMLYANSAPATPGFGTGDVFVTNSGAITTTGTGITRENAAGNTSVGITDPSNGIYVWSYADATGGNAGNITVDNLAGGNITTHGEFSDAIFAQTTSLTGSAGEVTVKNDAKLETFGDGSSGIYVNKKDAVAQNNGVTVMNTGTIMAHGGTAVIDPASGPITADGIEAYVGDGDILIVNSGYVSSDRGTGILAIATNGGTGLQITNSGTIMGGTAGVMISGTFVSDPIDNSGTIGSLNDLAIDASGLTITTLGEPLVITNYASGVINGYVTLGSEPNVMNNAGLWNLRNFDSTPGVATTGVLAVAVADFGASGSSSIDNTGTIALLGAPAAGAPVNTTGQYLPLAPGSVVNAMVNNPFNAMTVNGPVQGQIIGVQTFTNSGVIDLTANPVAGDVLVISGGPVTSGGVIQNSFLHGQNGGVFVANGGQLRLNTILNEGGVNSQSDMLVVDSTQLGSAPTSIVVNPVGGTGALTVGDGIALVEVLDKTPGASADGVFVLGKRVASGIYEYALFHNGVGADADDGNWYLRTTNIRPEVPLDSVVPSLASRLGFTMLGTIGHRNAGFFDPPRPVGRCRCQCDCNEGGYGTDEQGHSTQLWGRLYGETGEGGGGGGNSNLGFGRNGPAYNFNYGGLQVGDNLICHSELNHAGLYFNAATARSHVLDANSAPAGRITTDAYGFGGYWTHHNQNGWYTDLVLQTNWYENIRTRSVHGDVFDTRGWSFAASGETGYMFAFANGYSIIPQGQLIYQRTSINSGADSFARIHYDATDEVYGRLGVRLAKNRDTNNRRVTTWTETNFWHQFGGDARTTFTSLQGNNPATVTSPLGGTWAQIGLGLSGRLTDHVNAFGAADYNIEMERAGHSFGGQVGVEIGW